MIVIVRRVGFDRSRIRPAMPFYVRIRKRDHRTTFMCAAREIEERIAVHVHAKRWAADAVGVHIRE